jgi:hypothetical protein
MLATIGAFRVIAARDLKAARDPECDLVQLIASREEWPTHEVGLAPHGLRARLTGAVMGSSRNCEVFQNGQEAGRCAANPAGG